MATLKQFGVAVEVPRCEVRGWVKVFAVPEPAKRRFRPIKHTVDVNEALGKDTLMRITFPTKSEICSLVHAGECFISLDFAAYYDQFTYSKDVGRRFCFRSGSKFYRLQTLAMGQRQAVEVAATATARFLDFDKRSTSKSIIDNVIFVGSRDDVIHDATIFVDRVRQGGARLNENTDDIAALVQTSGDWGGIHIDCTNKTACLADKSLQKTSFSWHRRAEWSWRNFAAHIGLLFWSWQIIELPMSHFFPLLRFVSEVGKYLTEHDDRWDEPAVIWPSAWPVLERWTALLLRNFPRTVPRNAAPEWIIATDASGWGWGYVAFNNVTGEVRTHGEQWSRGMVMRFGERLGQSVLSEPQAIVLALCHLLTKGAPTRVRLLTDNTVAQASFRRGFNTHSWEINECLRRVQDLFGPDFHFEFWYVPGPMNPANPFSRGIVHEVDRDKTTDSLRRLAGMSD